MNNNVSIKFIFFLVFKVFFLSSVFPGGVFVSADGSDNNTGHLDAPFFSIQKAVDKTSPGDTIFVLPGVYFQKVLIKEKKGNENNPFVIKALGHVLIKSPGHLSLEGSELEIGDFDEPLSSPDHLYYPYYRGAVIRIEHSAHVIIDGLEITGSEWFGMASLYTDHLIIRNCRLHDLGASGLYILYSTNIEIAFNEIWRACSYPRRIKEHGSQECISIVNTSAFEVMYNRIHESSNWNYVQYQASAVGGEGIDVKEHSKNGSVHHNYVYNIMRPGLYVDAWDSKETMNIELYNNVVHNTQNGVALGCENKGELNNIKVYNNLLYNNWLEGIILAAWAKGGEKKNIEIFNNTIYNNWEGGINLGVELHSDIRVVNNILYQNKRYRDIELNKGEAVNVTQKNNLIGINPLFVEGGNSQYNLQSASPAVDAGSNPPVNIKFDLNDAPRMNGQSIDQGAFEFGSMPVSPRVIFVSEQGDDLNTGTFYTPYATLQHALNNCNQGDKIRILSGIYQENVMIKNLDFSNDKVEIKALGKVRFYNSSEILNGDKYNHKPTLNLIDCKGIVIDGLGVHTKQTPATIITDCMDVKLINCSFEQGSGEHVVVHNSSDILLKYNNFSGEENNVVNNHSHLRSISNY